MENYTHRDYMFSWKWKDAIIHVIQNNWDKFKNDERINNGLLSQIASLKDRINNLHKKLNDVQSIADTDNN